MTFEIVVHNHNYPRLLAYQLSSLVLYPPKDHFVKYTLYGSEGDVPVFRTLRFFCERLPLGVQMEVRHLPVPLLRNRAVGRNDAALRSKADWVWFADTDYMFLRTCWSDLAAQLENAKDARFAAPLTIHETSWDKGDVMIQAMSSPQILDVDLNGIPRVRKCVAIGGLQIVHGPTVNRIGYCPKMGGLKDHWDFRSDLRFRRQKEVEPRIEVLLDSLLRIRHSQRGYKQDNWREVTN